MIATNAQMTHINRVCLQALTKALQQAQDGAEIDEFYSTLEFMPLHISTVIALNNAESRADYIQAIEYGLRYEQQWRENNL